MTRRRQCASAIAAALFAVLLPGLGHAESVRCQRAIAKQGAKFVQARVRAVRRCEAARVRNSTDTCPDRTATEAITRAAARLANAIDRACGGSDGRCGGDLTGEDDHEMVGFAAECMNLERGTCANAITTCADIATCVECIGGAAVDETMSLSYASLELPSASSALNACQSAIGKAAAQFLTAKSRALERCWHARLRGTHTSACTPPSPGDGRYLAAIAKAEAKKIAVICKACGGADRACDADIDAGLVVSGGELLAGSGGSDDLTPAAIGFATQCPTVTLPYHPGAACGTLDDLDGAPDAIDSLRELVLCLDCVTGFEGDCAGASQVPGLVRYPQECNGCVTGQPSSGPCPTTLEFTGDGPTSDLDAGWTGLAHDQSLVTNVRFTLAVGNCAGASRPSCGQCELGGPLPNAGGPVFNNQRCAHDTSLQCTDDAACLGTCSGGGNGSEPCNRLDECPDSGPGTACSGGTCDFFLGPPLPLSAGGVPVCITSQVIGSVSGTINVETGDGVIPSMSLLARVYANGLVDQPCPVCVAGTCDSGQRQGQPCTVNGAGIFGDVSFDCPPTAGALAGNLPITLENATGTQTVTLAATSPSCRAFRLCIGGANEGAPCTGASECQGGTCQFPKCFCDTCNTAAAEPCMSDAACPVSGGNPGVCGGKRCQGGPNNGTLCAASSECPSGVCGVPGQPTQPNACSPPDGAPDGCQPSGDGESACADGPVDSYCSLERFRGCLSPAECTGVPGQTCDARIRECFPDNGVVGGSVSVSGTPDPPCAKTYSQVTLGSLFCIPPSSATSVNAAGGLPGLGRLRLPGKLVSGG